MSTSFIGRILIHPISVKLFFDALFFVTLFLYGFILGEAFLPGILSAYISLNTLFFIYAVFVIFVFTISKSHKMPHQKVISLSRRHILPLFVIVAPPLLLTLRSFKLFESVIILILSFALITIFVFPKRRGNASAVL